ncbi:MAG TPA: ATP-binding protein [Thermoanaerobaculia bacterium]
MVSGASPALTTISFRRDVRLFFGALVGFLAVLIILLLLLLQSFMSHAREATWQNWSNIVAMTVDDITHSNLLSDPASAQARLAILEERYGVAGVTMRRNGHETVVGVPANAANVETFVRTVQGATLVFVFDASPLREMTRTFWATTAISLLATAIATLLLGFYLPRITGPIEHMLDAASEIETREPNRDEQQYIIETFRKSIATLKTQEAELQRMHDVQKSRADDLERVTAALTRSLASGFLAVDPDGRVVEMNSAAREILHHTGEANGVKVEQAFGPTAFTKAIRDAVDQHVGLTRVELQLGTETAGQVIGLTTVPLLSEQQQFLGVLALFTDLTHIRDLETRVREMQTLADLGEISAGIAHEFRNSLGTILGYLRLARRDELADRPLASIQRAEKEASELSSAVDSLLAFARPMHLARTEVDLLDLAQDIVSKMSKPDAVKLECRGEHAVIAADVALLSRAFENLIRNAIDSVAEKGAGSVTVTVKSELRPAVIVEDNGVGVDPADVPRLLLPFQSEKRSGYGLGLPLSRKIALLHGATLTLTGTPGQGAVATIEFVALDEAQVVQLVTTEAS